VTFKDLKKRVSITHEIQQQTRLFDRLRDKPFWIWDVNYHKRVDIENNGDCCFNHIIGLPLKDGVEKPLFDYERRIFDALQSNKHIWIKKATGLGITEYFLRYIADERDKWSQRFKKYLIDLANNIEAKIHNQTMSPYIQFEYSKERPKKIG
jgi:hypothetical protein